MSSSRMGGSVASATRSMLLDMGMLALVSLTNGATQKLLASIESALFASGLRLVSLLPYAR